MALPDVGKVGAVYLPDNQPIVLTNEPTTQNSSTEYQITSTVNRYIDPTASIEVKENTGASPTVVDADTYTVQYVGGIITFQTAPTPTVTISCSVWQKTVNFSLVLGFTNWTIDRTRDALDITEFREHDREFIYGLRNWTLTADRWVRLTQKTNEALAAPNGVSFSGYLLNAPILPSSLTITDGVETFSDDGAGTLTGDAGGSGTITYHTGAWAVTFNAAPTSNVLGSYEYGLMGDIDKRSYVIKAYTDLATPEGYVGYAKITNETTNVPDDDITNQSFTLQGTQALKRISDVE